MNRTTADILFVSGLSGAGKSVALSMLEDLEYFVIDNLPLVLAEALNPSELATTDARYQHLAISIDARASARDIARFPDWISSLREQHPEFRTHVLFLTADEDVLLQRYSETRRKHPLTNDSLSLKGALAVERHLLDPIAATADISLDTSQTNLHELRELIRLNLSPSEEGHMSVVLQSFGFKYGVPDGVDLVFDVRCLPNPHWDKTLRHFSGRDEPVGAWLAQQPLVGEMQAQIENFLDRWLPEYQAQDRNYMTVAIGCTGGKHRSVYLVEQLAKALHDRGQPTIIRHTELR